MKVAIFCLTLDNKTRSVTALIKSGDTQFKEVLDIASIKEDSEAGVMEATVNFLDNTLQRLLSMGTPDNESMNQVLEKLEKLDDCLLVLRLE